MNDDITDFHEAANIFPLDEINLPKLVEDILANGQQVPIEVLDGKIIDGRRRFRACELAGVDPKFKDVEVADPVAYVLSLNLHRRHLTESQRGMIGAKAREVYDQQAKDRQKASGGDKKSATAKSVSDPGHTPIPEKGRAADKAGNTVGVSGRTVERATKVLKQGVPELVKAVEAGEISVKKAVVIAELPAEAQREVVASGGKDTPKPAKPQKTEEPPQPIKSRGKGIQLAHDAINVLRRIPVDDALRKRGFQIVADFIEHNINL